MIKGAGTDWIGKQRPFAEPLGGDENTGFHHEGSCRIMKLRDLISDISQKRVVGNLNVDIQDIAYHSGRVDRGVLFVCVKGTRADGHTFIEEALDRGARALVVENEQEKTYSVPVVVVPDTRAALAKLSAAFFGYPSRDIRLVGVTGTNGKTTTTYLIESMMTNQSLPCGVIGTVNYRYGDTVLPAPMTTPESYDIQKMLRHMAQAGITVVVMEVSSHALDLGRIQGCHFDVGVFTNVSQDHLDHHANLNAYRLCKEHLFTEIIPGGHKKAVAVLNVDDPTGERLSRVLDYQTMTYSVRSRASLWTSRVEASLRGVKADIHTPRGPLRIESPLVGDFNLYNILAATGTAVALGISEEAICRAVHNLSTVPGRMERIENDRGVEIFVDYAHTPDALERALTVLRSFRGRGRLITLFGCGGDRDRTKRPLMGAVAARLSDLAIITSDNPRSEPPGDILRDVEAGFASENVRPLERGDLRGTESGGYLTVENRREAIDLALQAARAGDIVLIAGKGHEDYQILDDRKVPFDDRHEVREALAKSTSQG